MKEPKIIAEIGCNHKGEMKIAKELIFTAATFCKADAVKFQKRCPRELLSPEEYNAPHPNPANSYGDTYGGEIHLSFGMTTKEEEEQIVSFFEQKGRAKDLVVYSCTSGYPVPFEDICLLEIRRLIETFGKRVKSVGFSGHHLGIAADVAAVTLGAEYIERHYTLDRTWKGTDHAASLEPDGVRKLARNCRQVYKALTYKKVDILDIEAVQRKKLKANSVRWEE